MTDREALLRAVVANLDDDTPRLIYADCLDELGGDANAARARFIRLQIETYRGPGDTGGTTLFDQKCQERDKLLHRFGETWLKELPAWAVAKVDYWTPIARVFNRGFIEQVEVKPGGFGNAWWDFFETNPIRALEVRSGTLEQLTALLRCPSVARLRVLKFSSCVFGNPLLVALSNCPHLHSLRELDLGICQVSDRGLAILARCDALPSLRTIRLGCDGVTESGISDLLTSARLPNLWEIDLRQCRRRLLRGDLRERFPKAHIRY